MSKTFKKPKLLSEFLDICRRNEYFAATIGASNSIKDIQFLTYAPKLQANIERQWLFKSQDIENSLKTYRNEEFAEYGSNLSLLEKYSVIRKRDRLAKTIPFGLIDISQQSQPISLSQNGSDENFVGIDLANGGKSLKCLYLVTEKQSQEYFYRIQRLRKIWWMKYAANPGRFLISEVKQGENETKSVAIKANYPFGNVEIENIELFPIDLVDSAANKKSKTNTPAKVISTTTISEVAVIETVLDSIDAGDFGEMCIHRKIAPYQCTMYSIADDPEVQKELKQLTTYISMLLQRSDISVLSSAEYHCTKPLDLEGKYHEMDKIGVPYGIILDEESLKTGLLKLRNRDTSLAETIHISSILDYLPKIFR